MPRGLLMAALLLGAGTVDVTAQSLFATRGLGMPMAGVDARARVLGGIGVGLLGVNTTLANPAEVAGTARRGVSAAVQPVSGTFRLADEESSGSGTRFPLVAILFPLSPRLALSAGYTSAFEQSWGVIEEGEVLLDGRPVPTRDDIRSEGGISQVFVGLGVAVTPSFAVGAAAGVNTGTTLRAARRTFPDSIDDLVAYDREQRWTYNGAFARVGMRFDPDPAVRLGVTFEIAGDLDVEGQTPDTEGATVELPMRITAGASALLSPTLMIAAGGERAMSGATDGVFSTEGVTSFARDTWRFGGGLEFTGTRGGSRIYPIRLGGSYAQLPYYGTDESAASEWAFGAGIGVRFQPTSLTSSAAIDASFERGGRSGLASPAIPDGLSESYWRFTFSLSLFGR